MFFKNNFDLNYDTLTHIESIIIQYGNDIIKRKSTYNFDKPRCLKIS